MHLKNLFNHPHTVRPEGVAVFTRFAKESDLQAGDAILQPGSTVKFAAGGVKYSIDGINDEYRCTVQGGKFADGQRARFVGAMIEGNLVGANVAFHQGTSVKFDGCVIRSDPSNDAGIRPTAKLCLTTGPVESLFIDGQQIF